MVEVLVVGWLVVVWLDLAVRWLVVDDFLFNSGTRSLCVQYMKFQAARQIPWRQSETRHVDCRFPPPSC